MCGKGSNSTQQTQTSTTTPNPQALAAYQDLLGRATNVSNTPWNPATGQSIAGFSPDQLAAFEQARNGISQPYINNASMMTMAGAGPVTGGISQYMNPFQQSVIDSTMTQMDQSNAKELSGIQGKARMSGSYGGDREAVAGELARQGQRQQRDQTVSGLNMANYSQALGAAQNDAGRSLQGAGIMGNLSSLAGQDWQRMMGIGAAQQGLDQARLDAASGNAAAESAYPFQTLQWLAGILGGATPNMGSTTNTTGTRTGPQPNTWSQLAGAGIAALPYLNTGGRVPYASGGGIGDFAIGANGEQLPDWNRNRASDDEAYAALNKLDQSNQDIRSGHQSNEAWYNKYNPAKLVFPSGPMGGFGQSGNMNQIAASGEKLADTFYNATLARPTAQSGIGFGLAPNGIMQGYASGGGVSDVLKGIAGSGLLGIAPMAFADGVDEEDLISPMAGLMKMKAAGGGIGFGSYVPQVNMPGGGGGFMQPAAPMRMDEPQQQKGLADHFKEIQSTAKGFSDAGKGIGSAAGKVGEWMRTETNPNVGGGWGTTTTAYADPMQNAGYALSNTFGGIGNIFGGGYAAGGAVDDNDPAGAYAPGQDGPSMQSSIYPPLVQQAFAGPSRYETQSEMVPTVDVQQRTGAPPTAGDPYAPPPVDVLNPRMGGIGAMPAPAVQPRPEPAPQGGISGLFDRFNNWRTSGDGAAFLTNAGAAMMANSGVGGKGSFGIHAGQGIQQGLQAQSAYRKGEREKEIETKKMALADRAQQIREAEEGRAAAMHPYDRALKEAQAKALTAQATAKEDPSRAFALREAQARAMGIDPTSQAFKQFVLTGKLPDDNQKYAETAATTMAKRHNDAVDYATSQQEAASQISQLRDLSQNIGAPGIGNTLAQKVGPYARSIGVELGNLSDMEAFNAITSKMIPLLRPPGSGTMSDKDVELFRASLPQLAATVGGRNMILDQMEAMTRYAAERGRIASMALNGELSARDAEIQMRNLPDPMTLFRNSMGQAKQQPSPTGDGTTKTIGGKTYIKRGGQWYEQ